MMNQKNQSGFILVMTLILLLIIAIVVLAAHFNVTQAVRTGGSLNFQKMAEVHAQSALLEIEKKMMDKDNTEVMPAPAYCADTLWCQPGCGLPKMITYKDAAKQGTDILINQGFKTYANNEGANILYLIQNLGQYKQADASVMRITVYAHYKGGFSVIESGYLYNESPISVEVNPENPTVGDSKVCWQNQ